MCKVSSSYLLIFHSEAFLSRDASTLASWWTPCPCSIPYSWWTLNLYGGPHYWSTPLNHCYSLITDKAHFSKTRGNRYMDRRWRQLLHDSGGGINFANCKWLLDKTKLYIDVEITKCSSLSLSLSLSLPLSLSLSLSPSLSLCLNLYSWPVISTIACALASSLFSGF